MTGASDIMAALEPARPATIVFYSLRGGVGRTTIAVNAAFNLRPLALLDFDLEAPGIDEFEWLRPPVPHQPGLLEFVAKCDEHNEAPPLSDYVYEVGDWSADFDGTPHRIKPCQAMRAGFRNSDYLRALQRLNWDDFYRYRHGHAFLEDLRAGLKKKYGCNLLLVDSRTGLGDVGRVCTGHLADGVVFVFEASSAHKDIKIVAKTVRDRVERERRSIPRLYVCSRMRRTSEEAEDSPPSKMCEVAREIVSECEGCAPNEIVENLGEGDEDGSTTYSPDLGRANLLYSYYRGAVPNPQRPDAFLLTTNVLPNGPSERALSQFLIEQWIGSCAETWWHSETVTRICRFVTECDDATFSAMLADAPFEDFVSRLDGFELQARCEAAGATKVRSGAVLEVSLRSRIRAARKRRDTQK